MLIPITDRHVPEIMAADGWLHFALFTGDEGLRANVLFVHAEVEAGSASFAAAVMRALSDTASDAYLCRRDGTVAEIVDREGGSRPATGTWTREDGGIRLDVA